LHKFILIIPKFVVKYLGCKLSSEAVSREGNETSKCPEKKENESVCESRCLCLVSNANWCVYKM